jgi:hypothetical protein
MNSNQGPDADPNVDNAGHLGGLITGIFAGISITEFLDKEAKNQKRIPDRFTAEEYKLVCGCRKGWCCSWCGVIGLIVWLGGLLIIFYCYTDVNVYQ